LQVQPVASSQDLLRKVPGCLSGSMQEEEKLSRFFCAVLMPITEPMLPFL
jgi:hypothetical protein